MTDTGDVTKYLLSKLPDSMPAGSRGPVNATYKRVNIGELLAGGLTVQPAEVLCREDNVFLFYKGTVNSVIGESESGKTWMVLLAAYQEIRAKRKALFLDFEDSAEQILLRLKAMGLTNEELVEYFAYISPSAQFNEADRMEFESWITEYSLVAIDGVTEAMTIHNLSGRDENEVAKFYQILPLWIAEHGPAVVLIDHVTKSKEGSATHAIGSQHKKNLITGASYRVDNKKPMAIGLHGESAVMVAKDKRGNVRQHQGAGHVIGILHLDSDKATSTVRCWISLPAAMVGAHTGSTKPKFPVKLLKDLTSASKKHGPLTKGRLRTTVTGTSATIAEAIDYLVVTGFLKGGGNRQPVEYVKDYDQLGDWDGTGEE